MAAIFVMLLFNVSCIDPPEIENTAPNASFSVDPLVGNTETIFEFDASESVDYDDDLEVLEIRWDWNNDGEWDTDFSTNKIILHQFTEAGVYTVGMQIKDPKNSMSEITKIITVYSGNSPPTAVFTIDPEVGFIDTTFTFDASDCSDIEDPKDSIRVRWDFEGDGTWDTQYSKHKIAYHKYLNPGTYSVTLEAKDTKGLIAQRHGSVEVTISNAGPMIPSQPNPSNAATDESTLQLLRWSAVDPDGDPITFNIYFGTTDNPPLIISGSEELKANPGFLDYETKYYWNVIAKDNHGLSTAGPLWTFTTGEVDNYMDSFVDARDGKTYKTVSIGDQVWMAENLDIGTMIHSSTGGALGDGTSTDNGIIEKYCYANDPENSKIYGSFYQWDELMQYTTDSVNRGICPEGWHLPTLTEWEELTSNYHEDVAGSRLRYGSSSGFQAMHSGYLYFSIRVFQMLDDVGYFWSSTEFPRTDQTYNTHTYVKSLYDSFDDMHFDIFAKTYGLSVRCIRDPQ